MKRVVGWTFLIFFGLVAVNYFLTLAGNFFAYGGWARADQSGAQLASIDFSMFDKNGAGRSYITQGYGRTSFAYAYVADWHNGIDIAAAYGAPVYSPADGTVIATGNQDNYCPRRGFGRFVAIKDAGNGLVLWFAHLGKINVSVNDAVKKNDLVATVGSSGFETGTHLHLSIFSADGFSMAPRNGCGPDATGHDLNPLSYLGTTYQ